MLTRRVRIQVLAFVVVALSTVAYVGFSYAGLSKLFSSAGYGVSVSLAQGGGIFEGSEVTYRGVAVGSVDRLRLTDEGMAADLLIEDSAPPIPANTEAVVANRSAIGEQYIDLQPRTSGGPYLEDGSVIPRESTTLPLPVSTVLSNLSELSASVPEESLRTVVDELYRATQDVGPELQLLLDSATSFTDAAEEALPETTTLIQDGSTVLETQLDSAQHWRSFGRNARLFADELAAADGDLRRLISTAPPAATQLSDLLQENDPELSVLLANLLTTSKLFVTRTGGLEELFVSLPQAVAATSTAITPDGGNFSVALTFFDPPPCTTGYESTEYRSGEDTSPAPFNTAAGCTLPVGSASSVRGSQNAPSGGVPEPAVPGSAEIVTPLAAPDVPHISTTLEELLWLME